MKRIKAQTYIDKAEHHKAEAEGQMNEAEGSKRLAGSYEWGEKIQEEVKNEFFEKKKRNG